MDIFSPIFLVQYFSFMILQSNKIPYPTKIVLILQIVLILPETDLGLLQHPR